MTDPNHDIVPTLRMFDGVMTGLAADEIERLRKRVAELEADAEAEPTMTSKLTTAERATIMDACASISRSADALKECHTVDGDWGDDVDAKAFYEAELRLLERLTALLAPTQQPSGEVTAFTTTVGRLLATAPHFEECETPEPCLSALIHRYYENYFDREKGREYAELYIAALYEAARAQGGEKS
ncbi:hypothetical protein [Burkholderia multivorans]|uniref:hypothetical protein n=1 Tax=Burkholderia multivorans TaxID=87883 RepID=UPI001590F108|nr:hypothetical protein [Burkholderia multivorans]